MKRLAIWGIWTGLLLMLVGLLACLSVEGAATKSLTEMFKAEPVKGIKFPLGQYSGQYQGQARAILTGEEGRMQADPKIFLIKGMKVEAFHETGERELVVKAPECFFNVDTKVARSASRLELQTLNEGRYKKNNEFEDKGLFIEGEGFEWNQPAGTLVISNQVHTVLHRQLIGPAPGRPGTNAAPLVPLEIFADHADINITNRMAVYVGHVKVVDAGMEINCGRLTVSSMTTTNSRINSVLAEEAVTILNKQDQSRATGEKATFAATNNIVTLTGKPSLENAQGRMTGDLIVLRRDDNLLEATGNVRMDIRPGATNEAGMFKQGVKISADSAIVNLTNRVAVYIGTVRADDAKMQLTSDWLRVVGAAKGGGVEQVHARTNVVMINREDHSRASGNEGLYVASSNVVTLDGNPGLENQQGKMMARQITLDRNAGELLAKDEVRMEILSDMRRDSNKTNVPTAGRSNGPPMLVFADLARIHLTNRSGIYTGNVRADDSRMLVTADKVTLNGKSGTNRLESILAEGKVTMTNRLDRSGARGDKMFYQATNDTVIVTSNAMLENSSGRMFGERIVLNRPENLLTADGGVKTEYWVRGGIGGTPAATNAAVTPELLVIRASSVQAKLTNREAVFLGKVQAESPRMTVDCERLTVESITGATNGAAVTNGVKRIVAEGNQERVVIVDRSDNTRVTGTNAVYVAATNTVEVIGQPVLEHAAGNLKMMAEHMIRWNRTTGKMTIVKNPFVTVNPKEFQKSLNKTNSPAGGKAK